jgi:hypothetical protein
MTSLSLSSSAAEREPWRVSRGALSVGVLLTACGGSSTFDPLAGSAVPMKDALPTVCQPISEVVDEASLLLDDFEDGDAVLDDAHALHGVWYVANDGTGTQVPSVRDEPSQLLVGGGGTTVSPNYALHTSGQGFAHWGAFVGARFNATGSHVCTYDISGYTGLQLSVKGEGSMRINLGTLGTTPIVDGGACTATACSDYGFSVPLTSEWEAISVPFTDLTQPGWASPATWEPADALRISFWAERGDFDFWLDDIRLYR